MRIGVVSFGTTLEDRGFRDFSSQLRTLRASTQAHGVDFLNYTFSDLSKEISGTPFQDFPRFKKGVGAWFWKPIAIEHFLKLNTYDYLIYLDADCRLHSNPEQVIKSLPKDFEIAGFKINSTIGEWTLPRVLKRLSAGGFRNYPLYTAGILIVKNSELARKYLSVWRDTMNDPRVLMELPFERNSRIHRHDQSVLSILVAKKRIIIEPIGSGFFSNGIESTQSDLKGAWVSTGSITNDQSVKNKRLPITRIWKAGTVRLAPGRDFIFWAYFYSALLRKFLCK